MRMFVLALGVWLLAAAVGVAADDFASQKENNWHQFRGPDGTGVASQGNPPVNWDENTNIKWKLPIPGDSTATPIIWGNDIFAVAAVETDREGKPDFERPPFSETELTRMRGMGIKPATHYHQFFVFDIDRTTGKIKWQKMVRDEVPHEGRHADGSFAAMTPTTDGKYLYVSFGSRGIYCFDFAGNQIWTRDLGKMNVWGSYSESTSPVLHGDTLVIQWDHEYGSFMTVLDSKTGETRWKIDRDEKTSFSTPLVTDFQGRSQIITYGKNKMRSNDLANGRVDLGMPSQFHVLRSHPDSIQGHGFLHDRLSRLRVAGRQARLQGRRDRHRPDRLAGKAGDSLVPVAPCCTATCCTSRRPTTPF